MLVVSLIRKYTSINQPINRLGRSLLIPQQLQQWQLQQIPHIQRCFIRQGSDKWLLWEDDLLRDYVKHNGKKWNEFVQHCLPNRSPKQCRERWTDVLNPTLKRGPFSALEKNLLKKSVEALGQGQWTKISEQYLPQRAPRRLANEWSTISTNAKYNPWTKEEDELVLKGVAQFGEHAWIKIATHFLPWRNRIQIRSRYRSQLDPHIEKGKWTEDELDLLLRRTIIFGQDWNKVAEGLPGRTPEKCSIIWMTKLDPAMNKGPWSDEEARLFWERVQFCDNFVEVAEGLPGRNRVSCCSKFWSIVRHDKEFTILYGDAIKKEKSENGPSWRARVAKLVLEWMDGETSIRQTSNKKAHAHQASPWDEQDLLKLDQVVNRQLEEKGSIDYLEYGDWKKISTQFDGRDARQCKYQYYQQLSINSITSKGMTWTKEEDELLSNLVQLHGTANWDKIVKEIPNRNKQQCVYRWQRVLQFNGTEEEENITIIKHKRLSDAEKSLIKEGVQMFGPNWSAIRMTYLPTRTPDQIMRWWNSQQQRGNVPAGKSFWTEDEDKALQFAVNKYKNELNEITSWAQVSKLIQNRTPTQCRARWLYTLNPDIIKGPWTYEEEMQLLEIVHKLKLQKSSSNKRSMWPLVAKELNTGRSDKSCRSKYDRMQRKGHRFAF
jgi:hypothetical protein